jgi:hypothetical protein
MVNERAPLRKNGNSSPEKPNINQVAFYVKCELTPVIDLFHPDYSADTEIKNNYMKNND